MKIVQIVFLLYIFSLAQVTDIYNSGGPLMPQQAAYDVTFYDIHLSVSAQDSSIDGFVEIQARVVQPIDYFVVDLDTLLKISRVAEMQSQQERQTNFSRETGKIWIELNRTRQAGESISIRIYYGGKPLIAKRPPWTGGFTWAQTADGSPWIATTCQGEGADIWWPVKDHVSDEPDSAGIHIRVADPLFCASNGKLKSVEKHDDGTSTYHWFVSMPINNYDIALNIAPYKLIEVSYENPYGETYPFKFWVLPEDYEQGQDIMPEFMDHMYFFEEILGPYPFRADKYGVVQTPHLGMEHQTIIAYGANFDNSAMTGKDWGFDALHHHELSHEWWGNMVTNADWKDMWLHEGFGTYMQALYMEKLEGSGGYHAYIDAERNFNNIHALAPRKSQTSNEIWKGPPIYSKGATVLHVLRYLIGYENLKKTLRLMAYPDQKLEKVSDGSQTRFVTTNDFRYTAEKVSGMKLDWFFDTYVHQPFLPQLEAKLEKNTLYLSWKTPGDMPFPMPVEIKTGDSNLRVECNTSQIKIKLKKGQSFEIDPQNWLLFDPAGIASAAEFIAMKDYQKALELYKKILACFPDNDAARKMINHVRFAAENENKLNGNFFDSFLVSYKVKSGRIYTLSKEDNSFYMTSSRGKYEMYAVSDSSFIFNDFNGTLTLNPDPAKSYKHILLDMGFIKVTGEEIIH